MLNPKQCEALNASKMIGKKWSNLLLESIELNSGIGFNQLESKLKKISSKILSEQLQEMEQAELIRKDTNNKNGLKNSHYHLTEKGRALHLIFIEIKKWNEKWGKHIENCSEKDCTTCGVYLEHISIKQ